MDVTDSGKQIDTASLLARFLQESDARAAEGLFQRLLDCESRALRNYLLHLGVPGGELDDWFQDVAASVWRGLNARRQAGDVSLHHFLAYAKVTARNLYTDRCLRKDRPAFGHLRRRIDLLLTPENNVSPFARWDTAGRTWSGFKVWRSGRLAKSFHQTAAYRELHTEGYGSFRAYWEARRPSSSSPPPGIEEDLPLLLACLFRWLDTPLPLPELYRHVAELLEIREVSVVSLQTLVSEPEQSAEDRHPGLARSAETPESEVVAREAVRQEVAQLGAAMRATLFLSMAPVHLLWLHGAQGTAAEFCRALQEALDLPEAEAMALLRQTWPQLPLPDNEIAALLHISVNYVQVLRSRARLRVEKHLRAEN